MRTRLFLNSISSPRRPTRQRSNFEHEIPHRASDTCDSSRDILGLPRVKGSRSRKSYPSSSSPSDSCAPATQSSTFVFLAVESLQTMSKRVCAIDPGVRSFITMYDPDGMTLGVDDAKDKIFNRCLTIDREISRKSKEKKKRKRYRMNKRLYHMFRRVKAMVSDMHQKVSSWLSRNYSEVLLPSFRTSEMTSKQSRISSKCSRAMLTWSHYKFKKILEYKMERSGGKMIECEEHTMHHLNVHRRLQFKYGKVKYNSIAEEALVAGASLLELVFNGKHEYFETIYIIFKSDNETRTNLFSITAE